MTCDGTSDYTGEECELSDFNEIWFLGRLGCTDYNGILSKAILGDLCVGIPTQLLLVLYVFIYLWSVHIEDWMTSPWLSLTKNVGYSF